MAMVAQHIERSAYWEIVTNKSKSIVPAFVADAPALSPQSDMEYFRSRFQEFVPGEEIVNAKRVPDGVVYLFIAPGHHLGQWCACSTEQEAKDIVASLWQLVMGS